jgi:regulator of sirC expression with transglutaminase-like and TPR domain
MVTPGKADPSTVRDRFRQLAQRPDAKIDLATGALLIAAEDEPGVDVAGGLDQLERLADAVRPRLQGAVSDHDLVTRLNDWLFQEQGFEGNRDDYYDPRNSFLHAVLERRRGIPITLCVVYIDVARRLGLDAQGVGFPGHFLAKIVGDVEIMVDAFHGRILTRADCEAQLRSHFGPQAELTPELLQATPSRQILTRMLTNLKQIYLQRRQLEAAIACCDRVLLLEPSAALELRDRGLLYQELECFGPAADDLERFLALAPRHASAGQVQAVLSTLRDRAAKLH